MYCEAGGTHFAVMKRSCWKGWLVPPPYRDEHVLNPPYREERLVTPPYREKRLILAHRSASLYTKRVDCAHVDRRVACS